MTRKIEIDIDTLRAALAGDGGAQAHLAFLAKPTPRSYLVLHHVTWQPSTDGDEDAPMDRQHGTLVVHDDRVTNVQMLNLGSLEVIEDELREQRALEAEPLFRHTFTTFESGALFEWRDVATYVYDVLATAGVDMSRTTVEEADQPNRVTVTGTDRTLRLVCVLLNQHAEQTPWDGTPTQMGQALERTLSGPPV